MVILILIYKCLNTESPRIWYLGYIIEPNLLIFIRGLNCKNKFKKKRFWSQKLTFLNTQENFFSIFFI
jgi:hypothetical protein